jgi:acyl-CoA synthetase (AMP-forming)/AMP-acid ligase II
MTETMGFYSAGPRSDAPPEERGRLPQRLRGSFGAIVTGYEVKVVDPRTGVELGEEGIGELLVRGRFLMDGLYKQERQDVFDEDGWYHTGDRGYMRSGYLFFVGRSGDTIKTHGANVSVQEVELALETHPAVVSASVLGVSSQSEDDQVVVAAVAMTENAEVSVEEVRTYAAERLSSYKVPRTIIEIPSEQLPLLATGKIDKQALRVDLLRRIEPLLGPDD